MKRFFLRLFLFLLVIVLFDQLFGVGMAAILKNTEKGDWGRNNYIFNEVDHDVVILGSSRAIHHYDPKIFSDTLGMSCYNCGEDGMGIFLMYPRFRAIEARKTPKIVIYEVLPEYDLLKEADNLKYLKFLRPYTNSYVVDSIVNRISTTEKYKLWSNGYRFNSVFVDIVAQRLSKAKRTAKDYTYMPEEKVMSESMYDRQDISSSVDEHLIYDEAKLTLIEDMIVRCMGLETKLIFTVSPKYKATSDPGYYPLQMLCEKYGVSFIDHYCDTGLNSDHSLFADTNHLNMKGAVIFSSQLASEIKEIVKE